MLRKILYILLALPLGAALVTLAVVNRHAVPFALDPFHPEVPSFALPLYVYILASLIVGAILGGMATWFSQGQWRRAARVRGREARRWHAEADRLTRERDAVAQQGTNLITAGR